MNHTIATVEAEELRSMFRTVAYAADKRHAREPHRCVHLSVRDQHLTLCATDGFQLGKAWTTVEAGDTQSFGLLVDVLDVAVKMLPKTGVVEIARVEDCVTFECDSNTSHVPIMTDWSGYEGIKPSGEYRTAKIDLRHVIAECRHIKLNAAKSSNELLNFIVVPETSANLGAIYITRLEADTWRVFDSAEGILGRFESFEYKMQYRFFARMVTAAVLRNKHQDHRISLRDKSLALIETFNETGHVNALHMIAPYNDRRKR